MARIAHAASVRLVRLADRAASGRSRSTLAAAGAIHSLARGLGPTPLVVWSPQSSGSTALHHALQRSLDRPVLHLHHADPAARRHRETVRSARDSSGVTRREEREADWLLGRLASSRTGPVDIVTVVRDPVARLVSHWFQFAHSWGELPTDTDAAPDEIARAIARFELLELGAEWFERELGRLAEVDLGSIAFDPADGFAVVESGRARVLVLRTVDLEHVASAALSGFVGREVELVRSTNRATDKPYASLYRRFMDEGELPAALVDRLLAQPAVMATHSPAELDAIRRRWRAVEPDHLDPA